MAQVKAEEKHGEDIESGNDRTGETKHHHGIDIVVAERVVRQRREPRIGRPKSKLEEMKNDKSEQNYSAHDHVS